ncbi:DHA2 family efflux MFS transporter permease subunit [Streptomyces griseoluteus]|uniref:DHA2 family efflux MFS transporter permease subunit n=1 Tax=Streptomyces griseoluteus TaxID=29306 RepID=A0A4Z1DGG0_STRGP|nr:MDR family MFS transporter [Streptomyces griseoluteus]TGN82359.1 DHA2 family efflux MFS transporter permease subunit [Streptomyces griseoluteus]GHF10083.1 MFS transporter [Streptomyces griseoluteus]
MSHDPTAGRAAVVAPPNHRLFAVMTAAVVAMLLAALDSLILGTAMPTIVGELGGLEHLSWVASAYMLATAATTPIWGKLGDMYGRKGVFLASIALFLAGSVVSGLAQSMGQLIGFRVLQGLGSGGLMVGALSLIGELVTPRERGKFQAMSSAVMGVAMVGGPLAGGFLTDHLGWRYCFYVNVPFGLAAFVTIAVALKLPKRRSQAPIDYPGAALLAAVITSLVLVTTWGGTRYDWSSPVIIGLIAIAVAGAFALLAVERRAVAPVLPLTVFRSANFSWANVVSFLFGFVMVAAMTFLPIYQQTVQGASASSAGLLMLPLLLGMVGTNAFGGQLMAKQGNFKLYAIAGGVLLLVGILLLSLMDTKTGRLETGTYMVVFGVGLGLLMQVTLSVAMESVEMKDLGVASSMVTLTRTIGGAFGVSLAGIIFNERVTAGMGVERGATGGDINRLSAESLLKLPEPVREVYEKAVADGTHWAFLTVSVVAAAALAASWFIKARPKPAAPPLATAPTDQVGAAG